MTFMVYKATSLRPRLTITTELLATLKSAEDLKKLKLYRINHVCNGKCGIYHCHPCRNLKKAMCRTYHIYDTAADNISRVMSAQNEIAMRLVYEYMFDMISIDHITSGAWRNSIPTPSDGHAFRIFKLSKIARRQPSQFNWLSF